MGRKDKTYAKCWWWGCTDCPGYSQVNSTPTSCSPTAEQLTRRFSPTATEPAEAWMTGAGGAMGSDDTRKRWMIDPNGTLSPAIIDLQQSAWSFCRLSTHSGRRWACTWWSSASGRPDWPRSTRPRRDEAWACGWWSPSWHWRRCPFRLQPLLPAETPDAESLLPVGRSPGRAGGWASWSWAESPRNGQTMEQIDPVGLVVLREDTGDDDKKDKIKS